MAASILSGKKILAVDDEPDVLRVIEMEIVDACPDCVFETAATFETAAKLLEDGAYDIVILDIMGVRGFDLLDIAVKKNLKGGHVDCPRNQSGSPQTFLRNEGKGLSSEGHVG